MFPVQAKHVLEGWPFQLDQHLTRPRNVAPHERQRRVANRPVANGGQPVLPLSATSTGQQRPRGDTIAHSPNVRFTSTQAACALRLRAGISPESRWSDSEADRSGAGVEPLVPYCDREICGAERERTGEVNGVSPAQLMGCGKRTGSLRDIG